MTKTEFLAELQDLLRSEDPIPWDQPLDDLEGWDSMAMLAVSSFAEDGFGIALDVDDFKGFSTPADIYGRLVGHGG